MSEALTEAEVLMVERLRSFAHNVQIISIKAERNAALRRAERAEAAVDVMANAYGYRCRTCPVSPCTSAKCDVSLMQWVYAQADAKLKAEREAATDAS